MQHAPKVEGDDGQVYEVVSAPSSSDRDVHTCSCQKDRGNVSNSVHTWQVLDAEAVADEDADEYVEAEDEEEEEEEEDIDHEREMEYEDDEVCFSNTSALPTCQACQLPHLDTVTWESEPVAHQPQVLYQSAGLCTAPT